MIQTSTRINCSIGSRCFLPHQTSQDMEAKSRQQLLEEILQRLCRVKFLNVEVMDDLLRQLKSITRTKGDEESSLLFIVQVARKELKKAKTVRNETERSRQLRRILNDVTYELTNHIRIYFQSPSDSVNV